MRIIRTKSGNDKVLVTKEDWERIGKKGGWFGRQISRTAQDLQESQELIEDETPAPEGDPYNLASGDIKISVSKYGPRHFAVYVGGQLLCVTVYKKGAEAVGGILEQLWQRVQDGGKIEAAV